MSNTSKKVAIVGAGLVGSLFANILAKKGYQVSVYERRVDPRLTAERGRSINMALSHRGLRALQLIDMEPAVMEKAIPMKGRIMHDTDGALQFQPYGKEHQAINSISRSELNITLIEKAEATSGIEVFFDHQCTHVDLENNSLTFSHNDQTEVKEEKFDLIFGADGAFSAIRSRLQKVDRFTFSQYYLDHGYKELTIPAGSNGTHQLDVNALHIWPRKDFMLIALPNPDGSFTCTLFLAFEGENSFESLQTADAVTSFFHEYFPDAARLIPDLEKDFFNNPTSSLITVRCKPWSYQNKILLIGDAAHGIVPFYGQGMNAGFEDCTILDQLIDQYCGDWDKIIPAYEENRIKDANAISDLALDNFIEMRDKVGDPHFLLRKKIEAKLYAEHPDKWTPLYSLVTFSDTPYAEAQAIGKRQEAIMKEVMKHENIAEAWEGMDFSGLIK